MPILFIPIDRPDLGDGPLRGINFGKCPCAEKQAFYALSRMLNLGTNALFWYEIALAVGVNLHPRREQALSVGVDTARAALSVSRPTDGAALSVGVNLRYGESCSIRGCRHG